MKLDKRQVILEAVKQLKTGGFKATAIKVELESNLYRSCDEEDSLRHILNNVSNKLHGRDADFDGIETDTYKDISEVNNPIPEVAYARFYNDGSVDSELTFTLKLDKPENIFILPMFIEAWNEFSEEFGTSDVSGAGMHMALLNTPDYDYPSYPNSANHTRFRNFRKSMQLLLPALYFLGAHSEVSRSLEYRRPAVESTDDPHGNNKFVAIGYNRGAVEFRLFDTCYDTPEAILDNVVVMKNCMRYWSTTYIPSGMEKITEVVDFGIEYGHDLKRFYTSVTHCDLLSAGLQKLKPAYLTIPELKKERGFKVTKRGILALPKRYEKQAELDYAEYSERFEWSLIVDRHYRLSSSISNVSNHERNPEKLAELEKEADQYIEQRKEQKDNKKSYITKRVRELLKQGQGHYTLSVNA